MKSPGNRGMLADMKMDKAQPKSPAAEATDVEADRIPEVENDAVTETNGGGAEPEFAPVPEDLADDAGSAADEPAEEAVDEGQAATALEQELAATRDQLLRLQADFENFRKRTQRERGELILRANEDLVGELLPVLDHFELGLRNAQEQGVSDSITEGFGLVLDQLQGALKGFGVEPLDAEGKPFDPHHHEAVSHIPSDDVAAEQVIVQTRRGYRMGDRLLRATQVVVSSGPAQPPPGADGEGEP